MLLEMQMRRFRKESSGMFWVWLGMGCFIVTTGDEVIGGRDFNWCLVVLALVVVWCSPYHHEGPNWVGLAVMYC